MYIRNYIWAIFSFNMKCACHLAPNLPSNIYVNPVNQDVDGAHSLLRYVTATLFHFGRASVQKERRFSPKCEVSCNYV